MTDKEIEEFKEAVAEQKQKIKKLGDELNEVVAELNRKIEIFNGKKPEPK